MAGWIARATARHEGSFGRAAAKAGKSTAAFARSVLRKGSHASAVTRKRAQLARTLSKLSRRHSG